MTDHHLSPEVLDQSPQTREWREFKERSAGDWGLAGGTYEGVLSDLATVQRKDTGQWVIRMVARVYPRDRYALAWVALSSDPRDPYALNAAQTRALAKVADALGILTPAPPEEIVDALARHVGKPVSVRVVHTPVGPRATLAKAEGGEQFLVTEERHTHTPEQLAAAAEIMEGRDSGLVMTTASSTSRTDRAQAAQEKLLLGLRKARSGIIETAEACHLLLEEEGWLALGYEGLAEYLAQPEVGLARTQFYDLANIHRRFVIEGSVEPERLAASEHSKLALTLPALTAGKVTPDEAAADAESLGWRDLREKYRDLMAEPKEPKDPSGDPGPDEPGVCSECGRAL